jgi:hypothetical protein
MHCQEFEARINALLDARQSPEGDSLLNAHAASCAACLQLLAGQQTLFSGLAEAVIAPPDRDFARRVVAQAVARERAVENRSRWPVVVALLATAAALLVGVSLLLSSGSRVDRGIARSTATPHFVAKSKRPAGRLAMIDSGPRLSDRHGTQRVAITGADLLLEAPRLPQRLVSYGGAMDEMMVGLPNAARRLDEVEEVVPGIRPLRFSLSLIWDTLVQTVPAAAREQPRPNNRGAAVPSEIPQVA